jgi:(p)ppGpp synthase/HD superfamily hydrolase
MPTLEHAIAIAAKAHEGQIDKAGAPYVLHPLRLMLQMSTAEERIVAVLHDVVEDCDWTPEQLRAEGFSEGILEALDSVTKREGEDYEAFIRRSRSSAILRIIRISAGLRRLRRKTCSGWRGMRGLFGFSMGRRNPALFDSVP